MSKTFWTVEYTGIGYNGTYTAYFDNKAVAEKFAERDYTDKPIRHTLKNPEKIKLFENNVIFLRKAD